jgi:hypothetical protein
MDEGRGMMTEDKEIRNMDKGNYNRGLGLGESNEVRRLQVLTREVRDEGVGKRSE